MDQTNQPTLGAEARPREAETLREGRDATALSGEYFSVRLTHEGSAQVFEDPRHAGEAFFRADPAERPAVMHVIGNTARTMARTEIHGVHDTGETRYFKALPDSHAPDAAFRAGFLEAMETSLKDRLGKIAWSEDGPGMAERLDSRLKDDLEAFARREPDKAAALSAERTDEPAPGAQLQAALRASQVVSEAETPSFQTAHAEKPTVIASGDWITTDRSVDLRPVAVATGRGMHAGVEAKLPDGETEISFSQRAFEDSTEALRHAWEFYEGADDAVEIAVARRAAIDRDLSEDGDRAPFGLVREHREQPEIPHPETALYAGEDAQLIMTFGRDEDRTRDLAEKLAADPGFRRLVAEHIPDAGKTLGPGRFLDGEGSAGFLPNELPVVTFYGRDGGADLLAKFPDEGPLSEALARHLLASPVVAAHLAPDRAQVAIQETPAQAISAWIEESSARIDRLPPDLQPDLHAELQDIARETAAAFGVDQPRELTAAAAHSTSYSAPRAAIPLTFGTDGIGATAEAADAERVDAGHQPAAEPIRSAPTVDTTRRPDPLIEALGALARVQAMQGSVAFRTEDQARGFAEEMMERYGAVVLRDLAAGRTEALAADVPDPVARQAMAMAVVSAATSHPALGLSAHVGEAAERRIGAGTAPRPAEHAPVTAHDRRRTHDTEREF